MNDKKTKVFFATNIPSPYRVDFFNELGKYCDLTVSFERKSSTARENNWHNYKFKNFKAVFLNGYQIKSDRALSFDIRSYLKKDLFDVFVIGGYSTPTGIIAIQTLKSRNIPFVLNTDGGLIKEDNWLKYQIKKHFISSADYWLSTGAKTTEYLLHYGARKDNIYLYPFTSLMEEDILDMAITSDKKNTLKSKLKIKEKRIILAVGSFVYNKGFDLLLRASEGLSPDVGLYIIGGKVTNEYVEIKEKYRLKNIHFIDFKSKEILKQYYQASDLFVLPTRGDVWGLVINEAMAMGLPVITTDKCVAGIELVENGKNGYIVPVENTTVLSEQINKVLSDHLLLKEMGIESLRKIQPYSIEKMAVRHIEIFNEIIGTLRN